MTLCPVGDEYSRLVSRECADEMLKISRAILAITVNHGRGLPAFLGGHIRQTNGDRTSVANICHQLDHLDTLELLELLKEGGIEPTRIDRAIIDNYYRDRTTDLGRHGIQLGEKDPSRVPIVVHRGYDDDSVVVTGEEGRAARHSVLLVPYDPHHDFLCDQLIRSHRGLARTRVRWYSPFAESLIGLVGYCMRFQLLPGGNDSDPLHDEATMLKTV